ncbi:MAG: membrane protein insertase YidC [Rhizobiaceae bacterium]|nr:membrane protein insertase YidC [Rhizobiaceae bacterium]
MENNKNFLIAMALSIAVLVGWQFLVVSPRMEAQRQAQIDAGVLNPDGTPAGSLQTPQVPAGSEQQTLVTPAGRESVIPSANPAPGTASRDQALGGSARVAIDTPTLTGSINLQGARLDDLRLKNYHETVDDASPTIVLLSPEAARDAYYAEFGYAGGADVGTLPGPATVWSTEGNATLSPDAPVTLAFINDRGVTFRRQIAIDRDYMFTMTDTIENASSAPVSVSPYGRIVRFTKPQVAAAWVVFEGLLGVFGEEGVQEATFSHIEDEGRIQPAKASSGWLGTTDKYWATALIPETARPFQSEFLYQTVGRPQYHTSYLSDPVTVAPGASAEIVSRTFAGPKVVGLVDRYESEAGIQQFGQLIDWGWFYFITRPLFYVIDWLFNFTGNFGAAILIVTVFLKLLFFPLANKSYKSMAKMKDIQPKIMELRERFGDDKMKQQQAMMEIYKKEQINPAAGCWPVLVQIPVFFALYKVLYVTIEMRHAPFFGWVQDLAAPDPTSVFNLFGLLPFVVPAFLLIGVWPLLMGVTMFVQMKLNPTPPDPTQKMIFTWMPVIFTFMLATFPAGLVIYWTWNNFLSIIQQSVIMKRNGTKIELFDNIRDMFKREPKNEAGQ